MLFMKKKIQSKGEGIKNGYRNEISPDKRIRLALYLIIE